MKTTGLGVGMSSVRASKLADHCEGSCLLRLLGPNGFAAHWKLLAVSASLYARPWALEASGSSKFLLTLVIVLGFRARI